jgi:hypothetical protein
LQLSSDRPLPNEFSTFPLSSLVGLQYWDRYLQVRHGDASGSEALLVFESADTLAGEFGGCIELQQIEGRGLCPVTENEESQTNLLEGAIREIPIFCKRLG